MGKKEIDYLYYHKKLFAELEEKTAKEKKADIERLSETQNGLLTEKKSLESKEKGISRKIKDLKINIRRVRAMVGVWILVPFLGGGAGYAIGSTSCQYKATTKIYNMKTNEQIRKPEETYTGENYYYKIVVRKGFPWEKKIDSNDFNEIEKPVTIELEDIDYTYFMESKVNEDTLINTYKIKPSVEKSNEIKEELSSEEFNNLDESEQKRILKRYSFTFNIIFRSNSRVETLKENILKELEKEDFTEVKSLN